MQPVLLRIGTIWGPLVDPESPFFPIPECRPGVIACGASANSRLVAGRPLEML